LLEIAQRAFKRRQNYVSNATTNKKKNVIFPERQYEHHEHHEHHEPIDNDATEMFLKQSVSNIKNEKEEEI